MSNAFLQRLRQYDYTLPTASIAQKPSTPRDAAKLLVADASGRFVASTTFATLGQWLPASAVVVLNDTKVVPARLKVKRTTGGAIRLLILGGRGRFVHALVDKAVRPGDILRGPADLKLQLQSRQGKTLTFRCSKTYTQLQRVLQRCGETPLPPYLKRSPLTEAQRRKEYQTVFARSAGSVAAPTASLHFTSRLMRSLKRSGVDFATVTLHVGLGTFAPLAPEHFKTGKLHSEWYSISAATAKQLTRAKQQGRPIIAVGTTAARTLESAAVKGRLKRLSGTTQLFIQPGYRWRFVDGLITNFHVPQSSLLLLVASLIGRTRLLALYHWALRTGYQFLSFGDAMLILPRSGAKRQKPVQ